MRAMESERGVHLLLLCFLFRRLPLMRSGLKACEERATDSEGARVVWCVCESVVGRAWARTKVVEGEVERDRQSSLLLST